MHSTSKFDTELIAQNINLIKNINIYRCARNDKKVKFMFGCSINYFQVVASSDFYFLKEIKESTNR